MNIRNLLRKHGMTLSRFANMLSISRPTLDSYIQVYESGQEINNEKFQLAFEYLFSDQDISNPEFYVRLDKISMLLKRERLLGMTDLSPEDSDDLIKLFLEIVDKFKSNDFNRDIFKFINIIIHTYDNDLIIKDLTNYFLIINLLKEINSLDKKELYKMAIYNEFFNNVINSNNQNYDKAKINNLISRINETKKERVNKEKEITHTVSKLIKEKIAEEQKRGINIEKLSPEEIIELLKNI